MKVLPKKINNAEQKLQDKIMAYLYSRTDLKCWRSPNYHAKNAGLPDVCILVPAIPHARFIGVELKVDSPQSKKQKEWQTDCERIGGEYHLIHSLDELKTLLNKG